MYSYLKDKKTDTFYMEPNKISFFSYSDEDAYDDKKTKATLITTDMEDRKELATSFYNAGFFTGYLDGEQFRLDKKDIYYYDRNPNEISYAQYLLTKDRKYLTYMKKNLLYTLCRLTFDQETGLSGIFFPTVTLDSGDKAILTYTSEKRFTDELINKYPGWRKVRVTWDVKCIVNDRFIIT